MEFRLHGIIPVAKASGADTVRSAAGRLAAETVAWLPQATTTQAGARWKPVDDERAIVTLDVARETVDVQLTIDAAGRLRALGLERWNDSADPPAPQPFGGEVRDEYEAASGVKLAGSGLVGWDYGTPAAAAGEFFRYRLRVVEIVEDSSR